MNEQILALAAGREERLKRPFPELSALQPHFAKEDIFLWRMSQVFFNSALFSTFMVTLLVESIYSSLHH